MGDEVRPSLRADGAKTTEGPSSIPTEAEAIQRTKSVRKTCHSSCVPRAIGTGGHSSFFDNIWSTDPKEPLGHALSQMEIRDSLIVHIKTVSYS